MLHHIERQIRTSTCSTVHYEYRSVPTDTSRCVAQFQKHIRIRGLLPFGGFGDKCNIGDEDRTLADTPKDGLHDVWVSRNAFGVFLWSRGQFRLCMVKKVCRCILKSPPYEILVQIAWSVELPRKEDGIVHDVSLST